GVNRRQAGGTDGAIELDRDRLGRAWGEQPRNERLDGGEVAVLQLDAEPSRERPDQRESLSRGGRREDRDLHVDAAGALQVDLDQIRPAGGEDPDDASAVRRVAHLLGEHAVDAAGEAGVAAAGVALAE